MKKRKKVQCVYISLSYNINVDPSTLRYCVISALANALSRVSSFQ